MIGFYDIAYTLAAVAAAPLWLINAKARQKVAAALRQRMGHVPERTSTAPSVLIHAVSLGEINATRALVDKLRAARPDLEFIISTTTTTGYERGQALYGNAPRTMLIRYPLDLTAAVNRVLDRLRPNAIVLMEGEVWPNFVRQCALRNIPVVLVNGRITTSAFRNYRIARALTRGMFRRLNRVCAQDETYARRFEQVGVPRERIQITGTMKFDTAQCGASVAGAEDLARAVGLSPGKEPIWVCGSTGPGEEEICLRVYRALLTRFPTLRLVLVPRHPERFDEAAALIESSGFTCLRRTKTGTQPVSQHPIPIILGDTMGELRKFYSLADIVFVGRSLVDLGPRQHGSDMIEPAALAKPVLVGPFTHNFADAMRRFIEADALRVVLTGTELEQALASLLASPDAAADLGRRAAEVVRSNQGATDRHVRIILQALGDLGDNAPAPSHPEQPFISGNRSA